MLGFSQVAMRAEDKVREMKGIKGMKRMKVSWVGIINFVGGDNERRTTVLLNDCSTV